MMQREHGARTGIAFYQVSPYQFCLGRPVSKEEFYFINMSCIFIEGIKTFLHFMLLLS